MSTTLQPPKDRIWWDEPIERSELIWISIVFVWGLVMTFMMPFWHLVGDQNLGTETYKTTPEKFMSQTQAMVDEYTIREEGPRNYPVVKPPPGGDVYMVARLWDFWPILELEKDQSYRLHLSSLDWQHGFSLQPTNINLSIHPGYDMVVTVTPDQSGQYNIVCNEYCGIGHHTMVGRLYVVD